jgi:hypothetical protein
VEFPPSIPLRRQRGAADKTASIADAASNFIFALRKRPRPEPKPKNFFCHRRLTRPVPTIIPFFCGNFAKFWLSSHLYLIKDNLGLPQRNLGQPWDCLNHFWHAGGTRKSQAHIMPLSRRFVGPRDNLPGAGGSSGQHAASDFSPRAAR